MTIQRLISISEAFQNGLLFLAPFACFATFIYCLSVGNFVACGLVVVCLFGLGSKWFNEFF